MAQTLLMLIPQEAYLPAMVIGALLIIVGARKIGMGIIVGIIALAFLGPFIDALVDILPPWLFALLCLLLVMSLFRLVFGNRVADHVIARLLYDFIRAPFLFMRWLLHGFGQRNR
jgi:hypothetical protein